MLLCITKKKGAGNKSDQIKWQWEITTTHTHTHRSANYTPVFVAGRFVAFSRNNGSGKRIGSEIVQHNGIKFIPVGLGKH